MVQEDLTKKVKDDQRECLCFSDEKISLVSQTYELVESHIRRLDSELVKFQGGLIPDSQMRCQQRKGQGARRRGEGSGAEGGEEERLGERRQQKREKESGVARRGGMQLIATCRLLLLRCSHMCQTVCTVWCLHTNQLQLHALVPTALSTVVWSVLTANEVIVSVSLLSHPKW